MLAKVAITFLTALASFTAADICSPVTARKNTDGLVCNAQGSVARPAALGRVTPITGVNVQRATAMCRNKCLDNKNCKSFSFNPSTRACQIYSRNPAYQGFRAGGGRTFFTDRFCYIQNYTSSLGFQNPSFDVDAGAKFLQPWNRVSFTDAGLPARAAPGYNSSYAARFQVGTSIDTLNSTLVQSFSVCPNTTYVIYPYYKYLGQGNSSSTLQLTTVQANTAAGSSCASASAQEIPPGPQPKDWTPFPYLYSFDDESECDPNNIAGSPNCPGTKYTLQGRDFYSTVSMQYSLFYRPPPEEIPSRLRSRQSSQSPQPPVLDQFLVDMVVQKMPTPPGSDDPDFPTNLCNSVNIDPVPRQ